MSDSIPEIVSQEYFAKPMHALFRSYDLAAYRKVALDIRAPLLDLGCGNGAFGAVFCRTYGLDGFDIGVDSDAANVRLARRRGAHKWLFRGDARALPLESGSVSFIVANAVLSSIRPGHERALAEIARVLSEGGQFVMTTPTPGYTDILLPTRLFRWFDMESVARFYSEKTSERNGHRTMADVAEWVRALERVGFSVEDHIHYFSGREATWWSVLAMRPFQLFAALRVAPAPLQRLAASFTERLVRASAGDTGKEGQEQGYLLLHARKS